jgi:hypothetical protein
LSEKAEVDENTGANVEPVGETARWCLDQSEQVANFESRANPPLSAMTV